MINIVNIIRIIIILLSNNYRKLFIEVFIVILIAMYMIGRTDGKMKVNYNIYIYIYISNLSFLFSSSYKSKTSISIIMSSMKSGEITDRSLFSGFQVHNKTKKVLNIFILFF